MNLLEENMSKDEIAKKRGFLNEEEMLLYQDVCCSTFAFSEPESLEELYSSLKNGDVDDGRKKEDFEKYIKSNNLLELFNKVNGMPLLNRFVEIYIHNANGLSICNAAERMFNIKLQEAKELFDGEKEQELKRKLKSISHLKSEYSNAMFYINGQIRRRLSLEESIKYYEITDNITETAYRIDDESSHKKA